MARFRRFTYLVLERLGLLPFDPDEVDWNADCDHCQAHERLSRYLNESHEDNEQADNEEDDWIEQGHFDGSRRIGPLFSEPKKTGN